MCCYNSLEPVNLCWFTYAACPLVLMAQPLWGTSQEHVHPSQWMLSQHELNCCTHKIWAKWADVYFEHTKLWEVNPPFPPNLLMSVCNISHSPRVNGQGSGSQVMSPSDRVLGSRRPMHNPHLSRFYITMFTGIFWRYLDKTNPRELHLPL